MLVVVRCLLLLMIAITVAAGTGLGTQVSYAGQIPCAGIECGPATPPRGEARGGTGGCSVKTIAGSVATAFAKYNACLGLGRVGEPSPDAYFTFGARKPGLWTACELTINMIDRNRGGSASSIGYNCLKEARSGATNFHYTGVLAAQKDLATGHSYYVRVRCYGKYAGHDFTGSFTYSPDLVWGGVSLVDREAAAYRDLMAGGTAPDGFPVLLDAFLRHESKKLKLNDDEWVLAESYAAQHHTSTGPLLSKEAFDLHETPNVNWNANQSMRALFVRLGAISTLYATSLIYSLVLPGHSFSEETPSEVDAYVDGLTAESAQELQSDFRASSVEEDPTDVVDACSFTPETPVTTPQGIKPIGHLRVGQRVLAYNPTTGRMESEPILHVWLNQDDDLVDLTMRTAASTANGTQVKAADELIHTTKKHPFLTREKGFVPAGELSTGMHVQRADGSLGLLTGWKLVPGAKTMYNLEVEQDHTFTVGRWQWIVHNCGVGQLVSYRDKKNGTEQWAYVGEASPGLKAGLASDISRIERKVQLFRPKDGSPFRNDYGILPAKPRGYYEEWTLLDPEAPDRGAWRIITGGSLVNGKYEVMYVTLTHYKFEFFQLY